VVEITAHRLAQVVGEYLDSEQAKHAIHDCLESSTTENSSATATSRCSHQIRAHTIRCWLNKMGFHYGVVQKGVYIDGHELEDVVDYRVKYVHSPLEIVRVPDGNLQRRWYLGETTRYIIHFFL